MLESNQNQFVKLLWTYIIIMMVPVIILGALTIEFLFVRLAKETEELNTSILEQTKRIVDADISNMLTLYYQTTNNKEIYDFLTTAYTDKGIRAYEARQVAEALAANQINDGVFKSVGVYGKKNQMVVDKNTAYTPQEYYDKYLLGSGYSYKKILERLNDDNGQPFFISTRVAEEQGGRNALAYFQILNRADKQSSGMFVAIMDTDLVIESLRAAGAEKKFQFAILGSDGNVLLKTNHFSEMVDLNSISGKRGTFSSNGQTVLHMTSDVSGLQYVYVFPRGGLQGSVGDIATVFALLLFLTVVVSLILAGMNIKRIGKPIYAIIMENKNLSENLQTRALSNLLYNVPVEKSVLHRCKIQFKMEKICVLAISFFELEDAELDRQLADSVWQDINRIVSRLMNDLHICYYAVLTSAMESIYILNYQDDTIIEQATEKMAQTFLENHTISPYIGVGETVARPEQIGHSYDGAVTALRYAMYIEHQTTVYYKDIQGTENSRVYYTSEKEHMLKKYVKAGAEEQVDILMNDIYQVNFCERQISQGNLRRLVFDIAQAIYKIVDDIYAGNDEKHEEYNRVFQNVLRSDNLKDNFFILKGICLSLCEQAKKREKSSHDNIKEKIIQFLNENYSNKDLSLDMLAEHLGMGYTYLSAVFKEIIGTNFIAYLTMIRLEKAGELLERHTETVEQIANMTGFNSSNSFIRSFKKYYGVTPGKYKK